MTTSERENERPLARLQEGSRAQHNLGRMSNATEDSDSTQTGYEVQRLRAEVTELRADLAVAVYLIDPNQRPPRFDYLVRQSASRPPVARDCVHGHRTCETCRWRAGFAEELLDLWRAS